MDYMTVRRRAFLAIQERPQDVDLISHNFRVALVRLGVSGTMLAANIEELNRRWEYAMTERKSRKNY
jgi:hypothetical protein